MGRGKMFFLLICATFLTTINAALDLGDPCDVEGQPGVCKSILNCEYAHKLVTVELKKPTHCAYGSDGFEVVCCPIVPIFPDVRFRNLFTQNGKLIYKDTTCRYDTSFPIICCKNQPNRKPKAEPASCPAIPPPKITRNEFLWNKCLEYQRYVRPCISNPTNPNVLERTDTCVMSTIIDRITGGDPARPREFPHMALLGYRTGSKVEWFAGGSLISDRFVLTAGHIVVTNQWGPVQYARLGALIRTDFSQGIVYNVEQRIPHRLYDRTEKYYDIALLKLDRRVKFSPDIRPVCLPMAGVKLAKERVVAGWGQTGTHDELSKVLRKTAVKVYSAEKCSKSFIDTQGLVRGWDPESMMCAGGGDALNDTCQGDSGGPLMAYVNDIHCAYTLEGVTSWGGGCGHGGAYSRVSHYLPWIMETVWPEMGR